MKMERFKGLACALIREDMKPALGVTETAGITPAR